MMRQPFSFSVPTIVRFGEGVSADLVSFLPKDATRVALVRGASGVASEPVRSALQDRGLLVAEVPCFGEPTVVSINAALERLRDSGLQAIVSCGGGAALDSGKALSFCLGSGLPLPEDFAEIPERLLAQPGPIPCLAVPTTAGTGAEVTANAVLGISSRNAKISLRGRALIPAVALVDPLLSSRAPPAVVLGSGLDAVVQTIEAYTSCAATPFSTALTEPNIALGLRALKDVMTKGEPKAWNSMAWVSLSSGVALANSGLGAAHGLASVLGGRYDAPHGALCGRLLVPVLRKNSLRAPANSSGAQRLSNCALQISEEFPPIKTGDIFSGFEQWQAEHGLPRLADYGIRENDIEPLAHLSVSASSSKKNTVPLPVEDYAGILRQAL